MNDTNIDQSSTKTRLTAEKHLELLKTSESKSATEGYDTARDAEKFLTEGIEASKERISKFEKLLPTVRAYKQKRLKEMAKEA